MPDQKRRTVLKSLGIGTAAALTGITFAPSVTASPTSERFILNVGDRVTDADRREVIEEHDLTISHDLEKIGLLVVRGDESAVDATPYSYDLDVHFELDSPDVEPQTLDADVDIDVSETFDIETNVDATTTDDSVETTAFEEPPFWDLQWDKWAQDIPTIHEEYNTGGGARVAVIDTGIADLTGSPNGHPDLGSAEEQEFEEPVGAEELTWSPRVNQELSRNVFDNETLDDIENEWERIERKYEVDLETLMGGRPTPPSKDYRYDSDGHGTHVAGTIGMSPAISELVDAEVGAVGTAPDVELVDIKYFDHDFNWEDEGDNWDVSVAFFGDLMFAVYYAATPEDVELVDADTAFSHIPGVEAGVTGAGCDVINTSLGTPPISGRSKDLAAQFYQPIADYADAHDAVWISSAGNSDTNMTEEHAAAFPAGADNILSVSATGPIGHAWGEESLGVPDGLELDEPFTDPSFYTDHGADYVDLSAPGGDADLTALALVPDAAVNDLVLSTYYNDIFDKMADQLSEEGEITEEPEPEFAWTWLAGTSMAAPNVAGAAAVKIAQLKAEGVWENWSARELRRHLKKSSDGSSSMDILGREHNVSTETFHGAGFINPVAALEMTREEAIKHKRTDYPSRRGGRRSGGDGGAGRGTTGDDDRRDRSRDDDDDGDDDRRDRSRDDDDDGDDDRRDRSRDDDDGRGRSR